MKNLEDCDWKIVSNAKCLLQAIIVGLYNAGFFRLRVVLYVAYTWGVTLIPLTHKLVQHFLKEQLIVEAWLIACCAVCTLPRSSFQIKNTSGTSYNYRHWHTWITKSLPRKSAIVRGSLVLPHTKRKNKDLSSDVKSLRTSQNHLIRSSCADIPLQDDTDLSKFIEISGHPHTCNRKDASSILLWI